VKCEGGGRGSGGEGRGSVKEKGRKRKGSRKNFLQLFIKRRELGT
jgi:hypothetical protein